jgi:nucleoid-associated protein Lsr2
MRFGFEGAEYEIDLSANNAAAFRKRLTPFIERGRKAGRATAHRPARTAASRQRSGDIRAWAKDQGIESASAGVSRPASSSNTRPRPATLTP